MVSRDIPPGTHYGGNFKVSSDALVLYRLRDICRMLTSNSGNQYGIYKTNPGWMDEHGEVSDLAKSPIGLDQAGGKGCARAGTAAMLALQLVLEQKQIALMFDAVGNACGPDGPDQCFFVI